MKKKMITKMLSWTETPAVVLEQIKEEIPELFRCNTVSDGILCHLEHPSAHYQIGIVYRVVNNCTGCKSWLVYYPIKKSYVRTANLNNFVPVEEEMLLTSKRGNAKIEKAGGLFVVTFSRVERKIE